MGNPLKIHFYTVKFPYNLLISFRLRNNIFRLYATNIGRYMNSEEYWDDSHSYVHIRNITIPFLKLSSTKDDLVIAISTTRGYLGWMDVHVFY